MPLVSILVPVYNTLDYLDQCLATLINQTLKNIEIICVDDASTDGSLALIEKYADKDERVKLVSLKENVGGGAAKNIAIGLINSEFFLIVDSDDYCSLDMCEKAYKAIKDSDADVSYFGWNKVVIQSQDIVVGGKIASAPWAKIYRTSFVYENNIQFLPGKGAHDNPFYIGVEIFASDKDFSLLNEQLYFHRSGRIGSIQTNMKNNKGVRTGIFDSYDMTKKALSKDIFEKNKDFINSKYKKSILRVCRETEMDPAILKKAHFYFKKYELGSMWEFYFFKLKNTLKKYKPSASKNPNSL